MHGGSGSANQPNRILVVLLVVFAFIAAYLYVSQPTASTSTLPVNDKSKRDSNSQSGVSPRVMADQNARTIAALRKENAALTDRLATIDAALRAAGLAAHQFEAVPTNKGHITKRALKQESAEWEKRVRDPALIEKCRAWMGITADGTSLPPSQSPTILSQHWQDWFIYHNYFKGTGPGFYVDIGSNDPRQISNTYFLDMCLGWDGICVEPNPEYHASYAKLGRTCKLYKNCLSDQDNQVVSFSMLGTATGTPTKINNGGYKMDVTCRRLDSVLRESNVKRVDMLSIDIEGYEHTVLKATNFHEFDIQLVLMETFWLQKDDTDILMMELGYSKVANLQIDDIYEYAINDPPLALPMHLGYGNWSANYKKDRDKHIAESVCRR